MFKDPRLDELSTGFRRTPLHIAVISGDKRLAKDIPSLRPDLALEKDRRGWTPLHLASARASLKMVKLLLKAEPNASLPEAICLKNNQNGESILHFSVKSKSCIEAFELLVDKLALARISDPDIIINSKDYNGKTVLQLAAETGNTEMVQYLLESTNLKLEITDA
ncbi:hypothetical protein C5167_041111 [Papaver somniferum]|uniref:Uncharacterized protein n=1 Tax=Papaver somniferum TaxID=3469 RepID=A0A4Y7IH11_PAPSO|nr:hypothetical protein C5167_041111 [Papaver somniferum]